MDDFHPVIVDRGEDSPDQKDATKRATARRLRGRLPTFEEMAAERGMVLHQRQNSIFSEAWIPMAFVFLIAGLLAGRNLPLLSLGATLLIIYAVSTWWKENALIGVEYRRTFDRTRVFPEEPIRMTLHVANRKPLPLTWLRFDDQLPGAPLESGEIGEIIGETHGKYVLQTIYSLNGYGSATRTFTFSFPRRGYYQLGPLSYRSGDIFTLFTIQKEYDYQSRIVVYPQVWPLEALGMPAKEPFGELNVQRSLFTDPIRTQGIRDYHPRDRFRDIHWKASARRGELQTKVYDPSTGMTLVVFLNVATMRRHWMGFNPKQLERAVSVAASVANFGVEQKWAVGLYVNGSVPRSDQPIRVPPGRSPDQLSHILEALAATTEFATGSIEKLMNRESPRLPWAATLVLVTAHVTEEMAAIILRLKEAGRRVALISLAEETPPALPDILVYHIPPEATFGEEGEEEASSPGRSPSEKALAAIPGPHVAAGGEAGREGENRDGQA